MTRARLRQGSLKWETARSSRIGSSEIFDIVRYYASSAELQNCGINAEDFSREKPYTTVWALYHKMLRDGLYHRESLPPELAEYGHAVEPYGFEVLKQGRRNKLRRGEVYLHSRLIASLDISGVSEELDVRPFDYGGGMVAAGMSFVCEQKSIMPSVIKKGLPYKHIIQAQYQITMTNADFYILQIMVLKNDTDFERGKITQMTKKKKREYLKSEMTVTHIYFQNNEHLAALIKVCVARFFEDVDNLREPTPFIECDSQKNIIDSIRINTHYNRDFVLDFDLSDYIEAKHRCEIAESLRKNELQRIIEAAKRFNASKFESKDGTRASFSKDGRLLLKASKEEGVAKD